MTHVEDVVLRYHDDKLEFRKPPTLNPDGLSIKGCSILYAPRGQAGEYARLATNPYRGCGHKCSYCYVPKVLRMSRDEFDNEVKPRPDFLDKLKKDAAKYKYARITEQVLLCFTTDPYNPLDAELGLTRQVIQELQAHGLAICALTKGGSRALRDIDLFRPGIDSFASTLTTLDDAVSLEWESEAALPQDRIDTLKKFYDRGVSTWVSLEPVYDTEAAMEIIQRTHKFVDLFKVGRINYHRLTKMIDWQGFTTEVVGLLNRLGSNYYIKKDLQGFLERPGGKKRKAAAMVII